MGSTGAGRGAAGGGAGATGARPIQQGGLRRRATQRAVRAGQTGQVSTEEFIRATGVNPRTGRRVRRRP